MNIPKDVECSRVTLEERIKREHGGSVIFSCVSGSHAYSTNIEGSDFDFRGVFILPTNEVLAGSYIPQVSDEMNDITYYEIGRFLELAAKGNPNIIELLNIEENDDMIIDSKWRQYFPEETVNKFITMKLKHTFTGYAHSQIKKAKGLNKKINWEQTKDMKRKDVLDFCYVMTGRESSIKFKQFKKPSSLYGGRVYFRPPGMNPSLIGLAKVNNVPDLYSMYYMPKHGGIISEDSNDVQLRSIPKEAPFIAYLRFDRDAYSTHCKDYREYQTWIKERNPIRYRDNLKGEQGYDKKNMMHCVRLLNTAKDIADGKGVIVRRPEREELLAIRNDDVPYQDLLDKAESMVYEIGDAFDRSGLPHGVPPKFVQDLLLRIRLDNLL